MAKNRIIIEYGSAAGIPFYFSLLLRKRNIDSQSVRAMWDESSGYPNGICLKNRQLPSDRVVFKRNDMKIIRHIKLLCFTFTCLRRAKLIHYFGATINKSLIDAMLFKMFRIPRIITWAGGEARIIREARKNNPYFYRNYDEKKDKRVREKLKRIGKYVEYVATDPELAEYSAPYFKKVFILPQPIDIEEYPFHAQNNRKKSPIVLHIPTNRDVKGTAYIEAAVDRLYAEGIEFQFMVLNPIMTQAEVRKKINECDIYVDELRCGAYGLTAVEAMALGKPTLTYIRQDLVAKYPEDLPIVNANPDNILDQLRKLLLDSKLREDIGKKSRHYAEMHHSFEEVGKIVIGIYKEIGWEKY